MEARITHDANGVCVEVFCGRRSIILRMVGGKLTKTAGAGGFIPTVDFQKMLAYGREAYAAHHCPDCPAAPSEEAHHPVHFRKEDRAISNPRHWADRDDD